MPPGALIAPVTVDHELPGAMKGGATALDFKTPPMKTSRLKWIAAKGGVVTLSRDVYPLVRTLVDAELNRIVEKAVAQCGYDRRRMVSAKDVLTTFEKLNIKYVPTHRENEYESCRSYKVAAQDGGESQALGEGPAAAASGPRGSRTLRANDMVAHFQAQENCLILHRKPFTSMVTALSRRHAAEVRWTSAASAVLQVYTEGWMTKLFSSSVACAKYRNPLRVTIKSADVQQGRLVLGGLA